MLDSTTRKRIDDARDILVGKLPDPKSQVEQITVALIYKFMNDMDREFEDLGGEAEFFTGEYAEYKWSNIVSKEKSGFEKLNLYAEALEKLSLNNSLPALFRNIFKNVFLPYRDPETFNLFMKEINGFSYEHSEDLGDAFEYLLSIMSSQGDAGQFRTPRHIIDFIVDVVQPKKNESILDPACGTAGFLISAYKYIVKENEEKGLTPDEKARLTENIVGYDISPDMVRLSLVNLYLHLFPNPKIFEYDTLTNDTRWNDTFDIILANPPFMTPKGGIRPHDKFSISAKRSEVLFVDYIMEHLNINGRAGVIVPEGIVFQTSNAYKNLRKNLVENNYVWAVVSLPSGVFNPYSGVKTSILLMDREIAKKTDNILFVKINNDGYDLGAQRREIVGSDIPQITKLLNKYKESITINGTYGLADFEREFALIADKESIKEKQYILVGEKYKEKDLYIKVKYPIYELGELCLIKSGGTPSRKEEKYWDNGNIPWLGSSVCKNLTVKEADEFITEEGLNNSSAKWIKQGSTLVALVGATIGKTAFLTFEATTNQNIAALYPKDISQLNPKYLFCVVQTLYNEFLKLGDGKFRMANLSFVRELKIPVPPITIQNQIVNVIENYQKIIDGARQVVQNYMPDISIEHEWELVELGELYEINYGVAVSIPQNIDANGIKIISTAETNIDGSLDLSKIRKIKREDNYEKYILKPDTLLFNWRNAPKHVGKTVIFNENSDEYIFASFLLAMVCKDKKRVVNKFAWLMINKMRAEGYFMRNSRQAVNQTNFNAEELKNTQIPLPPLDVQQQIVNQIDKEMQIVKQNKLLIEIFEEKVKDKIAEVWSE